MKVKVHLYRKITENKLATLLVDYESVPRKGELVSFEEMPGDCFQVFDVQHHYIGAHSGVEVSISAIYSFPLPTKEGK